MVYRPYEDQFLIRLERGEEVMESLREFMRRQGVGAGPLTGLGACDRARVAHYNTDTQEYRWETFEGPMEIVSLTGNLSWLEGEPFPHVHVCLSGEDMRLFGGHLGEARVTATCEIWVRPVAPRIERRRDESVGLYLLQIP